MSHTTKPQVEASTEERAKALPLPEPRMINILSIDAWNGPDGWSWNAWYKVGTCPVTTCDLTPRRLLAFMRQEGYLGEGSKGRVRVEDDGYNVVIIATGTNEPLFALEYGGEE